MRTFITFAFFSTLAVSNVQADLVINVSGAPGMKGRNGNNGASWGTHGTNAGSSTSGKDASKIDITLSEQGDGNVLISGSHQRVFNAKRESGKIVLMAHGGRGGDGGHGGNGANGYPGQRGHDATKYSHGTDGGPGGPGGDGGDGTSGSDGGDGGTITVRVKEKDMHLLYLLAKPDVTAGDGGNSGINGRGGHGGPGGSGGSSYSWQEPYSSTCSGSCPDTCTGTRSGANGSSVSYTYSCTRSCMVPCTKYESKYSPGGSNGWAGPNGRNGNAPLSAGRRGKDGLYKFYVEYRDGRIESYDSPFELVVTGFDLTSTYGDRFVQPGEKLQITNVVIRNRGGMPSPTMTPIRLRADQNAEAFIHAENSIDLTTSIPAGGSLTLKDPIDTDVSRKILSIEDWDAGEHRGGPSKNFALGVSSEIVGINRLFKRLTSVKDLKVQFPISLSRTLGKRSIAAGDDYLFRWSLENRANTALGGDSKTKRRIRVLPTFSFASGGSDFYLELKNTKTPGEQQVSVLNEGKESSLLLGKLSFKNTARFLDEGTLKLVVQVEDPYIKDQWHSVDVAYLPVKVGSAFVKTHGASVLLVTSPQTDQTEMKAWREVFQSLGKKFDQWDVGVMGPLDIGTKGIAEHYAGGTIVVLNDLMRQPGNEAIPVDAFFKLIPSDFLEVARRHEIGIYVYDRTGSYKAQAGKLGAYEKRTAASPLLVAQKVTAGQFKSEEAIHSFQTRVNLALASSFSQKIAGFKAALSAQDASEITAVYAEAIALDLALEQVQARSMKTFTNDDGFVKRHLPLLFELAKQGLIAPIDGSKQEELKKEIPKQVLEIVSKTAFLAQEVEQGHFWNIDPVVSKHTHALLENFWTKAFKAEKGIFSNNDAYKNVEQWIEWRIDALEREAEAIEKDIRKNDKTRYFTFPRAWNGDYYRQAVYRRILVPVFSVTMSPDLEIFKRVLDHERPVLPAFN